MDGRLLRLLVTALCLALVAGWFGSIHPALDSFSHFRLHLIAILLFGVLVAAMIGRWKMVIPSAVVIAVSLFLTAPHLPFSGLRSPSEVATIKVAQLNLFFANPELHKAHSALTNIDADFVLLQEVTKRTEAVLATLKSSHPFQHRCKYVGVAIASRHPFATGKEKKCYRSFGLGSAQFDIRDRVINLASVHLAWPWPSGQHGQIDRFGIHFRQLETPLILAGDFNAAPWSNTVRRIGDLSNTRAFPDFLPSWAPRQALGLRSVIGLPIDNTLISRDFQPISRGPMSDAGSDHLPIISVMTWKR